MQKPENKPTAKKRNKYLSMYARDLLKRAEANPEYYPVWIIQRDMATYRKKLDSYDQLSATEQITEYNRTSPDRVNEQVKRAIPASDGLSIFDFIRMGDLYVDPHLQ